jgi:hypothetical protein
MPGITTGQAGPSSSAWRSSQGPAVGEEQWPPVQHAQQQPWQLPPQHMQHEPQWQRQQTSPQQQALAGLKSELRRELEQRMEAEAERDQLAVQVGKQAAWCEDRQRQCT